MPTKKRRQSVDEKDVPAVTIPVELLKSLVPGPMTPAGLEAVFRQFKKAFMEQALGAELSEHLDGAGSTRVTQGNYRNGSSGKTVLTDDGEVRIEVPRDRAGTFEPLLIPKHERRFAGFDDKIVALYARGLTVREIQAYLLEMYTIDVSPDLISRITDTVMTEVTAWQSRPLDGMYPVVFFDALRVKMRDESVVRNKAVYLALGVRADGMREVLGLWIEQTEGAKFWLKVFTDLRARGVNDILIGVADGLKGLPEALEAIFPQTTLQTCIVHLIRNSLKYVMDKDRKAVASALRPIYTAATADAAQQALDEWETSTWHPKYPTIAPAWRRAWVYIIPFFAFPPAVRKIIYTTNAIESLNAQLRKIIKTRGHFPNDESASKLIWLALRNITADWSRAITAWREAMTQFAILFEERFTAAPR